jgi:RimJ/RimL family protein N-acetyltransferase
MQLARFIATHMPALEADEVRHNLMLGSLGRAAQNPSVKLQTWTLGEPGACAIRAVGWPIILGNVGREHCRALAEQTRELDYSGVVGCDDAPGWFVERATELGVVFVEPIPQRIHALRKPPVYPGAAGSARQVTAQDASQFADWLAAFSQEAVPHDPPPARANSEKMAAEGRHTFWVVAGEPVAMAGIARRTRSAGAISAVYTRPEMRGRGFAGSVTAAVAERLFAEGRSAVCLYTDLRNPASNRCYAKLGFEPHCDSWVYLRRPARG